jgi:short-subunit dehydrogenase
LLAAYAASKSYILSLGEALNVELAPAVTVTVLSPGLMDTGFNAASGYTTSERLKSTMLPTAEVAKIGLDALLEGRSSVVAGKKNARGAFLSRFFSRHALAERIYRGKAIE